MDERFFLAQISDTHVRVDDAGASAQLLKRALSQARELRADAILLTGDLVNDAREDEYALLADIIADPGAPLFMLPGNHDDRAMMRDAFPKHSYLAGPGHLSFVEERFPLRLVALDQIVPGETHGKFTEELVDWLESTLSAAPHRPTLVALHHPPFLTYDRLFDRIGLHAAERFAAVIERHKQVVRIVCGHHHRVVVGQIAHASVVTAPSSSWTYGLAFHPEQQIAPITDERPGWMLHVWSTHGGLASHFMGL